VHVAGIRMHPKYCILQGSTHQFKEDKMVGGYDMGLSELQGYTTPVSHVWAA
jgi:hypothetical protein